MISDNKIKWIMRLICLYYFPILFYSPIYLFKVITFYMPVGELAYLLLGISIIRFIVIFLIIYYILSKSEHVIKAIYIETCIEIVWGIIFALQPTQYDLKHTLLKVIPAILCAFASLYFVSREDVRKYLSKSSHS